MLSSSSSLAPRRVVNITHSKQVNHKLSGHQLSGRREVHFPLSSSASSYSTCRQSKRFFSSNSPNQSRVVVSTRNAPLSTPLKSQPLNVTSLASLRPLLQNQSRAITMTAGGQKSEQKTNDSWTSNQSMINALILGVASLAVSTALLSNADAAPAKSGKKEEEMADDLYEDEEYEDDEEEGGALFESFQKFFEFDDEDGYPKEVEALIEKSFQDLEAGSVKTGLEAFKEAVAACKKAKGEKSPTVTLLLSGGMILGALLGQHEAAKEYILDGLHIVKKNLGEKHPLVAVSYCYLALVAYSNQKMSDFAEMKDKCLAACELSFGKDDPMTKEFRASFDDLVASESK